MKKTVLFLLAAVLLVLTAPTTQAQNKKMLTAEEAEELLQKTLGTWQVKALLWQPETKNFSEPRGRASFSSAPNGIVSEKFEIEQPDGRTERVEGTLRYSEIKKRFEFVQLDHKGNSTLLMYGKWNPNFSMITFRPAKGQKHIAGKALWQYFFFDDGSFKKVVRKPDTQGNYMIASEYHCLHINTAGL
ncbi:hypothetical protein ACFSKU_00400 [Pontibacter silvestris]|uniref:DUF1579 domain-containing protein n=1 Tax=Pontibacter silvestris TaxID=2305183 RepID=A0ABW4WRE6_9BACT|nr:hypothetical protein [Pontibacter silvestris]MCC9138176.1 hypothetical protein [Pontibacter silvestris]